MSFVDFRSRTTIQRSVGWNKPDVRIQSYSKNINVKPNIRKYLKTMHVVCL